MPTIPPPGRLQHKLPKSKRTHMPNIRLKKNEQHQKVHQRMPNKLQQQQEIKWSKFRLRGEENEVSSPPPKPPQNTSKRKHIQQPTPTQNTRTTTTKPSTKYQKTTQSTRRCGKIALQAMIHDWTGGGKNIFFFDKTSRMIFFRIIFLDKLQKRLSFWTSYKKDYLSRHFPSLFVW